MTIHEQEIIEATASSPNMIDYETAAQSFDWSEIEEHFTWSQTGKVNMAYEAIDRHVVDGRGARIALHYCDSERTESFTYEQLSKLSSRFTNVLRELRIEPGERLFIFMPRTPELYISLLGALKAGIIVGPLFEAFMETAVQDRLLDSGASAIVTTPELLGRIRREELPNLKHIIVVGAARSRRYVSRKKWMQLLRKPSQRG